MTPCESVVKKIMGEPYAGNPQVRFEEEGGNPTFTLRYVDGMSLYRGYFAINKLDPAGTTPEHDQCLKDVENAKNAESVKEVLELLKKNGCSEPTITCECCAPDKDKCGHYLADSITICEDNCATSREDTLRHELMHALDDCSRKKQKDKKKDCNYSICTEIRAYSSGGACNTMVGKAREKCIKDGAMASVKKSCAELSFDDLEAKVNAVYDVCVIPLPGDLSSDMPKIPDFPFALLAQQVK